MGKIIKDYIGISVSFYCRAGNGLFVMHRRSEKCRDEQESWDFGGGQLEFGEDPTDGVLREVLEEYGVQGKIIEQLPAYSLLREHREEKTHWLTIPFVIEVDIQKIVNGDPEKISEIDFFELDNLPKPLHPGALATLNKFKKHFDKYRKLAKPGKS